MSSQFSYELDERQIKILMQNSEADYNEAMWNRFESSLSTSSKPSIAGYAPKVNISISRSVIIPALFVSLIGGLSILLFSFVDFKKKDEVVTEKPLEVSKPVIKPKTIISKPVQKAVIKQTTVVPAVTVAQTNTSDKKEVIASVPKEPLVIESPKNQTPDNNVAATKKNTQSATTVQPKHKRKRTKMVAEELQSISAPTSLSTSEEPELELK